MTVESTILSTLCINEDYTRQVIPYLKPEYFSDHIDKNIFEAIAEYFIKYNTLPSKDAIFIDLSKKTKFNEEQFKQLKTSIYALDFVTINDMKWLLDTTEKFCKDKALYNAIYASIQLLEDKNSFESRGAIPQKLQDALAVSFDNHIGHDYLEDAEQRYDTLHDKDNRLPFGIEMLNRITKGGVSTKTLTLFMAASGVGKSALLCHEAAHKLSIGKNVLYITCEMSEEKIAERIDENLFSMTYDDLVAMDKSSYLKRVEQLKTKTVGRLKIKEYPTGTASVVHFRHLLNELKVKNNFVPDVIYIDYLNICASARVKLGASVNTYSYVKAIAEEVRGMAIEYDLPIFSATQTNRNGFNNSDIDATDTSESIGVVQTVDLFLALIPSDQMNEMEQIMIKQLKNRYHDKEPEKFVVGFRKSMMQFYDVDHSEQNLIQEKDVPLMDTTSYGGRYTLETKPAFNKSKFDSFK